MSAGQLLRGSAGLRHVSKFLIRPLWAEPARSASNKLPLLLLLLLLLLPLLLPLLLLLLLLLLLIVDSAWYEYVRSTCRLHRVLRHFLFSKWPVASIHFGDGAITATAVVVGDGEAAIVEVVVIIMAIVVGCYRYWSRCYYCNYCTYYDCCWCCCCCYWWYICFCCYYHWLRYRL